MRRVFAVMLAVMLMGGCGSDEAAPERRCNAHAQCDEGFLCGSNGFCRPSTGCTRDDECCPGAVCFSGWCRPTPECQLGTACPGLGEVCEPWPGLGIEGASGALTPGASGLCVASGCDALGGCAEPARCIAGRCLLGPPCGGRCAPGQVCEVASERCLPAPEGCTCSAGVAVASLIDASPERCGGGSYSCSCALEPSLPPGRPGVDGRLVPGEGALPALVSYEPEYGDLVLSRFLDPGGARMDIALDGVPSAPASAAATYRGGVAEPGPDRGQRPAVAPGAPGAGVYDILYRDVERQRVMFTRVGLDGSLQAIGELPADLIGGLDVGRYLCLARRADQRLQGLVFVSRDGADWVSRLVAVESLTPAPVSAADWSVSVAIETRLPPRSEAPCADACGFGEVCVVDNGAEVCAGVIDLGNAAPDPAAPFSGACGSCAAHEVCAEVNAGRSCRSRVYRRYEADRLPFGEGLFASCAAQGDTVFAAWYDADGQRLVAARWPFGPGDRRVVDGPEIGPGRDPGRFASLAVDGQRLGIAYQDAAQATLNWAEAPSWGASFARETVPTRSGGEPGVGTRAAFVAGTPVLVHVDGRDGVVEIAARSGGCWARDSVFTGSGFAYPDLLPGAGDVWVSAQILVFDDALRPHHGPVMTQRQLPRCQ